MELQSSEYRTNSGTSSHTSSLPIQESQAGEEEIIARFRRKMGRSTSPSEPVVFEFTQDPALLHQYYRLRVEMYYRVLGTRDFSEREDPYDRISHILIARQGKLCLGGCRITVREPGEDLALPMENEHFHLKSVFPGLKLDRVAHAELSRFAIMADRNEWEILYTMSQLVVNKTKQLGIDYFFARSIYSMARNWRKMATATELYNAHIVEGLEIPGIPGYDDIKMYLTVFALRELHATKETVAAAMKSSLINA